MAGKAQARPRPGTHANLAACVTSGKCLVRIHVAAVQVPGCCSELTALRKLPLSPADPAGRVLRCGSSTPARRATHYHDVYLAQPPGKPGRPRSHVVLRRAAPRAMLAALPN